MILAKTWKGDDLSGDWDFTIKIDGVRAIFHGSWINGKWHGKWISRAGKPLYNIPYPPPGVTDAEIYCGTFKKTMETVKTKQPEKLIHAVHPEYIYSLSPLDRRLIYQTFTDPTSDFIHQKLLDVVTMGYEGLILRQGDVWLKVKTKETYDTQITKIIEGTKRNHGRMGAVMTEYGKVGIGFTDMERKLVWSDPDAYIGATIEVECMHLTKGGKFRHPRFVRFREDK